MLTHPRLLRARELASQLTATATAALRLWRARRACRKHGHRMGEWEYLVDREPAGTGEEWQTWKQLYRRISPALFVYANRRRCQHCDHEEGRAQPRGVVRRSSRRPAGAVACVTDAGAAAYSPTPVEEDNPHLFRARMEGRR